MPRKVKPKKNSRNHSKKHPPGNVRRGWHTTFWKVKRELTPHQIAVHQAVLDFRPNKK